MSKSNLNILEELTKIIPRRGLGEIEAAKIITSELNKYNIKYELHSFKTVIPKTDKAELFADGEEIACVGASYSSGNFDQNPQILNSFNAISKKPAIIFNPVSHGVCLQTIKDFPAVSINRDDVVKLVMANEIKGKVTVTTEEFESTNILVGNRQNPEKIIFSHYDSIAGEGAIDNAGSVAVLFDLIIDNQDLMKKHLFVFAGSEEESVSSKDGFWGFEQFDKKFSRLIDNAKQIIVLDGVGVSTPKLINEKQDWVFGISRIEDIKDKVFWMMCDQTEVMKYYHSSLDTLDKLKHEYLNEAEKLLFSELVFV